MSTKKYFIVLGSLLVAFACGFFTAQFIFKQRLSEYHRQAAAIARAKNVDLLSKEIELLVLSFRRQSAIDASSLSAFCSVISHKLRQVEDDKAIIVAGLEANEQERQPGLSEAQRFYADTAAQQLLVAKDAAKQMGCK